MAEGEHLKTHLTRLSQIADQIAGRIPLPHDAEKQVQDRNTLVFPGEATPFAV